MEFRGPIFELFFDKSVIFYPLRLRWMRRYYLCRGRLEELGTEDFQDNLSHVSNFLPPSSALEISLSRWRGDRVEIFLRSKYFLILKLQGPMPYQGRGSGITSNYAPSLRKILKMGS